MHSVRMFKSILEIDIGQRLLVVVAHNETGGAFLDRPRRLEAAWRRLFCSLLPRALARYAPANVVVPLSG